MDINNIISSFFAGTIQTILGHPLDTIKTRMQIDNKKLFNTINNIKKKEGLLMLYKGGLMPLIGNGILNSFLFTYHYNINKEIKNHYMSGIYTGIISGIILNPIELIKCNLQNNRDKKIMNMYEIINKMKKKNIKITNGLLLSILRDSIGLSIYFGSYEKLQEKQNNIILHGGLAGALSWLYSYPIDVIKTKKQINNKKIINIVKSNDYYIYMNGLSLVLIRAFLVNSGVFYTYENLKLYLYNI